MIHFYITVILCNLRVKAFMYCRVIIIVLSYDVTSGSKITPCNKIDKPLVVNIFTGNVMTSIKTLCTH